MSFCQQHFASKNRLPGSSVNGTLVENGLNADWFWGFTKIKEVIHEKCFVKTFTLFKYTLSGSLKRFKSTHPPPFLKSVLYIFQNYVMYVKYDQNPLGKSVIRRIFQGFSQMAVCCQHMSNFTKTSLELSLLR